MQKRVRLGKGAPNGALIPTSDIEFISSGCTLLDLALGGGWAESRICNVVGDKSSGKTLLAIEACANFALKYERGRIFYRECEAAFDKGYAASLGMPLERVDFGAPIETVEELFNDLSKAVKSKVPTLYIVDSLDALSDRAEIGRDMDEPTYGTEKARKMSQLFRRLVRMMASSKLTLMIISQVRSKIGLSFGRNTTRSGGRALDFYCSQVIFLQHMGTLSRTIGNVKRPVALELRAKCDKNKVGLPLREVEFTLQFGYGIDDLMSNVKWLKAVGRLDDIGVKEKEWRIFIKETDSIGTSQKDFMARTNRVKASVRKRWFEIEKGFLPKRVKYGEQSGQAQEIE